MTYDEVILQLKAAANAENTERVSRFGIASKGAIYGIRIPELRKLSKQIESDHLLAESLWQSGIHEGRILATMIDDPKLVTEAQMDRWVADFDSWDVCDQCCGNLFDKTPLAYTKAFEWSTRSEEFVKRAGFVLMAVLAVHDKAAPDEHFVQFLSVIQRESGDPRNFVKKAVSWALRQIGKRNHDLNQLAIATALTIKESRMSAARWIASDALRELNSEAVQRKWSD